jgi:uncharacterized protein (TIGR02466 family)
MKKTETLELFPTPVFRFNIGRQPTDDEKSFVEKCGKETFLNVGNVVSVDRYILDKEEMADVRKSIQFALDTYLDEIFAPVHEVKIYITQSWLNFTNPGQNHHPHSHPNSFLSGTFYFSANKEQDSLSFFNSAMREFSLPSTNYNRYNAERFTVPVETGDILVFPSNLKHFVDDTVQERTLTRISLAFNTFLIGQIGDEMHLTSLRL